jgi:DNA-binding transcriptional LysR family regulator
MTLADQYIREKRLIALFGQAQSVGRAFHAVIAKDAEARPEVKQFVAWLKRELAPA